MDTYWILGMLISLGVPAVLSRCPKGHFELMSMPEQCTMDLHEYKTQALTGHLDFNNQVEACSIYDEAHSCISRMVSACRRDRSSYTDQVEAILSDNENGFGRLCKEPHYFQRYTTHTACYQRVSEETASCMNVFNDASAAAMEAVDEPTEEDAMCIAIENLQICVTYAVEPSCGEDAAKQFVELCGHHIPQQFSRHCQDPNDIATTVSSGSAAAILFYGLPKSTAIFLSTTATLWRRVV